MKKLPLLLSVVLALAGSLRAADDKVIAAVRAADDARIAATLAEDRAALAAIYSDALHYGHSNAKWDKKASQLAGVVDGPNDYVGYDHLERTFEPAGPGLVLMKGRANIRMKAKADGTMNLIDLVYLAVWREEGGKWRFLAWQSCRVPAPAGAAKK